MAGVTTILDDIIQDFSIDKFNDFFHAKSDNYFPEYEELPLFNNDQFNKSAKIGECAIENTPQRVIVFSAKVTKDLTQKSGKKAQYVFAKNVLKQLERYIGGFFIFYDENGSFRLSFIYSIPRADGRQDWSNFRRYTYYVSKELTNRTFIQQMEAADFNTFAGITEAFSVEKVTDEFFEAYRYAIDQIIIKSLRKDDVKYQIKHSFAQQLLSRILFIYFLQRKGWLKWKDYKQDKNYIKNLWMKYKAVAKSKDTFYSQWLSSLFFGAFNKKNQFISYELPDEIRESFAIMPFLNGGLFAKNEFDENNFVIPDSVFEWLFEPDESSIDKKKGFLEIFNFTIDEASPDDIEVAVDPEMLGKVYESLINEEERGDSGIFYTPRVEIDFMCRFALVNYLHSKAQIDKQELFVIIFNPHLIDTYSNNENLIKIRKYLSQIKIVDPSVGSASFLLGMMNILVELNTALTKKIEKKDENLFTLKHRIILENLYGVDVKDWAVMVGELRLWLSLIIETDEKYIDIYTKPLLPNLSFKIRQGDSLVEEVGGVFINLRGDALKFIPQSIQQKITELIDKKAEFFSGKRSANLKEQYKIENLELQIFREILQTKIDELNKKLVSQNETLKQISNYKNLFGEQDNSTKQQIKQKTDEIEQLQNELNKYRQAISNINKNGKKEYFLWELDFAEVFSLNGGFDIVIGNPPYVRQELIAPPLENETNYSPDKWREIKRGYKDKLIKATQNVWNNIKKIDKKSDLYVFFYYQGLSLLNNDGIFCFINSNSWLDVGYGAGLQEFLLKNMKPIYIIDNIAKRSFKQADVNTVIVLIQKPSSRPTDFTLKFVAFKKPFEEAIAPEILKEIEQTQKPIFDHSVFRLYPKTKKELLEEGVEYPEETELDLNQDPENLPYIGNKWGGKYLRAPEIYFKILEKGKGKLVRLGDIAEVRFGIKTGANEFFYLKPVGMTVKEVVEIAEKNPQALIRVKNSAVWEGEIEAEFLKPVIKSPRELKTIMVRIEDLNYLVFMCHKSKKELNGTKALDYIKWGEKQKYNQRPTCANKPKWWDLSEWEISKNILPMFERERKYCFYNYANSYIDAALYWLYLKTSVNENKICLILNSSLYGFWKELMARPPEGGGGGPIQMKVYHYEEMPIVHISLLNKYKNNLNNIFDKIVKREIVSIFEEIGFNTNLPLREQEPNPLPDRKELDDIVFDALGLTEEERKEVYWAVAELVKARLDKAKSV